MYHGPDQKDIDEINALPDHDPVALKAHERRKLQSVRRAFRAFLIFLLLYFACGSLYQYVITGVFMRPAIGQYKLGRIHTAQSGLEKYLRWGGADSNAHYYLGMCLYSEGRNHDAIDQFEQDTSGIPVRNHEVIHVNKRSKEMIERCEE